MDHHIARSANRPPTLRGSTLAQRADAPVLRAALTGMLDALSSPEDDEGLCRAHGEEPDLCDGCLYDRQKRMRVAADAARLALAAPPVNLRAVAEALLDQVAAPIPPHSTVQRFETVLKKYFEVSRG